MATRDLFGYVCPKIGENLDRENPILDIRFDYSQEKLCLTLPERGAIMASIECELDDIGENWHDEWILRWLKRNEYPNCGIYWIL